MGLFWIYGPVNGNTLELGSVPSQGFSWNWDKPRGIGARIWLQKRLLTKPTFPSAPIPDPKKNAAIWGIFCSVRAAGGARGRGRLQLLQMFSRRSCRSQVRLAPPLCLKPHCHPAHPRKIPSPAPLTAPGTNLVLFFVFYFIFPERRDISI